MALREGTRRRLRVGCAVLGLLGLALLGLGSWLERGSGDTDPVAVLGARVTLPDAGSLGGRLALYGVPPSAQWPTAEELGCTVEGPDTPALVARTDNVSGPATLDRRVINGTAVLPLLEIVPADGATSLSCSGVARVAPAYVVVTSGVRDLAPMAAFSLASLALVLGAGGTLTLRPEES